MPNNLGLNFRNCEFYITGARHVYSVTNNLSWFLDTVNQKQFDYFGSDF